MSFLCKTYRIFVKIYRKDIVDMRFTVDDIFPPKGYVLGAHGLADAKTLQQLKEMADNFKEDYLGYPIYKYRYKRGIKVKKPELIEEEKRAIEALFEEEVTVE